MFCFGLRRAGTIWRTPELNGIGVMHQGMLTWKGDVLASTSCDENLSKSVEISKVMSKTFYIGCGDCIAANNVTTIHERRKASDHIPVDVPMNCCYVNLAHIKDK
jgi:hypothetical protein